MEPKPRRAAFITVTALAKYLAYGDIACGYATWYPSHFKYEKPPFDKNEYILNHGALVTEQAARIRELRYRVALEDANSFIATGKQSGTKVAGTADLVAIDESSRHIIIMEMKTGAPRPEHAVQARLYLLFAPWIPSLTRVISKGEFYPTDCVVTYRGGTNVLVPPVDQDFRRTVREAVAAIGGAMELPANPSPSMCRFCTVPDCGSRFNSEAATAATDEVFD